jgi:leucyl-tRNA synthetase
MAPHLSAELWERRHQDDTGVHSEPWPIADPEKVRVDSVTMVLQVNGKVRDRADVDAAISEDEATAVALAAPKVIEELAGRQPRRVVARPPRLVNVVV